MATVGLGWKLAGTCLRIAFAWNGPATGATDGTGTLGKNGNILPSASEVADCDFVYAQ